MSVEVQREDPQTSDLNEQVTTQILPLTKCHKRYFTCVIVYLCDYPTCYRLRLRFPTSDIRGRGPVRVRILNLS